MRELTFSRSLLAIIIIWKYVAMSINDRIGDCNNIPTSALDVAYQIDEPMWNGHGRSVSGVYFVNRQ